MKNEKIFKQNNEEMIFENPKETLFALQMYMNRFMWISTKEIVSGISSCYYSDMRNNNDNK